MQTSPHRDVSKLFIKYVKYEWVCFGMRANLHPLLDIPLCNALICATTQRLRPKVWAQDRLYKHYKSRQKTCATSFEQESNMLLWWKSNQGNRHRAKRSAKCSKRQKNATCSKAGRQGDCWLIGWSTVQLIGLCHLLQIKAKDLFDAIGASILRLHSCGCNPQSEDIM